MRSFLAKLLGDVEKSLLLIVKISIDDSHVAVAASVRVILQILYLVRVKIYLLIEGIEFSLL